MGRTLLSNLLLSSLLFSSACSPSSYTAQETLGGLAAGTAVGSGVGWLLAQKVGNTTENVLINGAIGAGVGLLAGALLHERNVAVAKERDVVQREARLLHENERELTQLRRQIEAASSWGNNETKSWEQRYPEENPNRPYQGPAKLFP